VSIKPDPALERGRPRIGVEELSQQIALLRSSSLLEDLQRDWRDVDFPIDTFLDIIYAEAFTALEILQWANPRILDEENDLRFLEVGAGAGLFSLFLQRHGYRVCALEPSAQGFEYSQDLCQRLQRLLGVSLNLLPLEARQLDANANETFDVIFSVNVVEHFQPLGANLEGMARVLSERGTMVHTCPNYWVPYEPHFRLPLVPFWPAATARLLPKRVSRSGLWKSFNFVNYGDIQDYAKRHQLEASFRRSALATTLRRLDSDPAFALRHRGPVKTVGKLLNRFGLTNLLERLPDRWSTPMTFQLSRPMMGR
jgi:SAM-dependent methyltransferase